MRVKGETAPLQERTLHARGTGGWPDGGERPCWGRKGRQEEMGKGFMARGRRLGLIPSVKGEANEGFPETRSGFTF